MEFEKLIELIHAVSNSNLTRFNLEDGSLKISMRTDKEKQFIMPAMPQPASMTMAASQNGASSTILVTAEADEKKMLAGNVITAPLVGTFYNTPSPDAPPFVKVGDSVKKGQTLAIVEAMKLMNEIESEFDGVIESILVENEAVVEYGQPLFVIK